LFSLKNLILFFIVIKLLSQRLIENLRNQTPEQEERARTMFLEVPERIIGPFVSF